MLTHATRPNFCFRQRIEHPHLPDTPSPLAINTKKKKQLGSASARADLDGVVGGAVLVKPRVDERYIDSPPRIPLPQVERPRRPVERDAGCRAVRVEGQLLQHGHHFLGKGEVFVLLPLPNNT